MTIPQDKYDTIVLAEHSPELVIIYQQGVRIVVQRENILDLSRHLAQMPSGRERVYLAGKVSGLGARELSMSFGQYEVQLIRQGIEVVNPLNIVDRGSSWPSAMQICIAAMMTCDRAAFMPCWKDSEGATIEHDLAQKIKFPIEYLKPL